VKEVQTDHLARAHVGERALVRVVLENRAGPIDDDDAERRRIEVFAVESLDFLEIERIESATHVGLLLDQDGRLTPVVCIIRRARHGAATTRNSCRFPLLHYRPGA
jgi:hypothetical protein